MAKQKSKIGKRPRGMQAMQEAWALSEALRGATLPDLAAEQAVYLMRVQVQGRTYRAELVRDLSGHRLTFAGADDKVMRAWRSLIPQYLRAAGWKEEAHESIHGPNYPRVWRWVKASA